MIEIGKNFLFGLNRSVSSAHAQKEKYRMLADQTEQSARKLHQDYEEDTAYLFRSASEKMRNTYERAREALAQRQSRRAAHGIGDTSASAADDAQTTQLAQTLDASRVQTQLQAAGSQAEKTFKSKWQALLQAAAAYRRRSRKNDRWSSLAQAVTSLFN